jgi:potassium-transporting ATPase potassium-binding subunit
MWTRDFVAIALTLSVTVASSVLLGAYAARVFQGEGTWLDALLGPIERALLRLLGVDPRDTQTWTAYARSLLLSNAVMWLVAWAIVTTQAWLPLNPDHIPNMGASLAFNTASSFVTNTNLQHYSGETGLSTLAQMAMVTWLQFVSAGTGMAALAAIIRALGGSRLTTVGHFYVDVTRATVRILLPLALVVGVVGLWQGVPMTVAGAVHATTLEGEPQTIARGVVAAEVAIKQLGTNGGGYFGSNAAHPFENPTPLTNAVQTWAIAVLPMAMVWMLGAMIGRRRLAAMLFATMLALYVPLLGLSWWSESGGSPAIAALGADQSAGAMEGKEVRVGAALSALWATTTTATSNGSVNAMHDSLTPLGGLVALSGMWLNTVFGGVGVGFIGLLIYVVVAVFVAGMMIGRTPELLGKKIEAREMQLASLTLLLHPALILVGTAAACAIWAATADPATTLAWLKNPGPHGFSEMLYEFTSSAANNGSGFEGLGDNTAFWNVSTGMVMLVGRYVPILAPLALAASLGAKPCGSDSAGSLATDSATFGVTLWAVVVVLGLLMFLPTAVLGPIAEQLAS